MRFLKEFLNTWKMAFNTKSKVIESINEIGNEMVWDIEMPTHHNFVANGFVAHNCHQVDWEDVVSEQPSTQYGIIINELMRRCKAKFGHDLRIFGYTGSPFRGTTSIKGPFWSGGEIVNIDTKYLVDLGFLVPTIFGVPDIEDLKYDLHDFESNGEDGAQDYTESQLKAMQEEIIKQGTLTQKIMLKVMELTRNRNGVLITCAGKKHCKEAAKYLPEGSYAIVTDDMGQKMRRKALKDAYTGKIKYVLQIGCLTTGVNIPLWDTSVILRKIMSLTLLVQLLGRGMRLLKSEQVEQGLVKEDHLVLDFTGTMFELGALYDDPILEEAELQRSERSGKQVPCPKCATLNSSYARRCIGVDNLSPDGRCEEFFHYLLCGFDKHGIKIFDGCGTKNDPCARYCRHCDHVLRDPNANLDERVYTDKEWTDVRDFKIELTKNEEGVVYSYLVEKANGKIGWAHEVFYPFGRKEKYLKDQFKMKALLPHLADRNLIKSMMSCPDAKHFMAFSSLIRPPKRITHRFNDKGRDIIHRKDFKGEQIEAA